MAKRKGGRGVVVWWGNFVRNRGLSGKVGNYVRSVNETSDKPLTLSDKGEILAWAGNW